MERMTDEEMCKHIAIDPITKRISLKFNKIGNFL
jgi:hypothetical protein